MDSKIYKIVTPHQWQSFQEIKQFKGSELDQKDEFIHLSFENQWEGFWQKFFNSGECYKLEIDRACLGEKLKNEANKPGGNVYPHYYGNGLLLEWVKSAVFVKANCASIGDNMWGVN